MIPYHTITIQINQFEEVLQRSISGLILIRNQEPYKSIIRARAFVPRRTRLTAEVLVAHLPRDTGNELGRNFGKNTIDRLAGECVTIVLQ